MIKFLLLGSILFISFISAENNKDTYFNQIIAEINQGTLTPNYYQKVSNEELFFINCSINADVSMQIKKGKKESYDKKTISIEIAFNNDIWLTKFDNHRGWQPYYYYHPLRKSTIDAVNELSIIDADIVLGSFQRKDNVFIYELEINSPYGIEYNNDGVNISKEFITWSLDMSNLLNGKSSKIVANYYLKRDIKGQNGLTALVFQEGTGDCNTL